MILHAMLRAVALIVLVTPAWAQAQPQQPTAPPTAQVPGATATSPAVPQAASTETFGGIGANVEEAPDGVLVTPMDGRPAAKAGLLRDDVVTHIDGEAIAGLKVPEVVGKLRGPAGSKVVLTVTRQGQPEPIRLTVTREVITITRPRLVKPKLEELAGLQRELAVLGTGEMDGFVVRKEAAQLPEVKFKDASGKDRTLTEWRGRVVVLNLWATWCAPCLREMPSLDRLKTALGGKDFDVVTVSTDKGGMAAPRKFLGDIRSVALEPFNNNEGKLVRALEGHGIPLTILVGRDGRELGRLTGSVDWDSADAKRLIEAAIKGTS